MVEIGIKFYTIKQYSDKQRQNMNVIDIEERLNNFITSKQVPNILFHGKSGTGKRTIVSTFLSNIYKHNPMLLKTSVMHVNCSLGKGIKFVREDLKNFAKSNINTNNGIFKSIVLYNADYLTIDAQSALRRCIEIFSTNTRFFIIIEDKYKLFNPILSRFCEIHIPELLENNNDNANFHKYRIINCIDTSTSDNTERCLLIANELKELHNTFMNMPIADAGAGADKTAESFMDKLINCSDKLYKNGVSSFDIVDVIQNQNPIYVDFLTDTQKNNVSFLFQKTRYEFRNETLFMYYLLDFVFMRYCVINKNM